MMKQLLSVILCVCILFCLTGCSSGQAGSSPASSADPGPSPAPAASSPTGSSDPSSGEKPFSEENIEILRDYVLPPEGRANDYTIHVVILRNNNTKDCRIETHSFAYDADSNVVEENRMEVATLGAGQTSAFMERFWPENDIAYVGTEFEIWPADGREVQSVLRLNDTPIDHGVDVSLTNIGDFTVMQASLCVLFFDAEGNCVDAQDTGMCADDNGSPIAPGDTAVPLFGKQLTTPADFAYYEIYYHGTEKF